MSNKKNLLKYFHTVAMKIKITGTFVILHQVIKWKSASLIYDMNDCSAMHPLPALHDYYGITNWLRFSKTTLTGQVWLVIIGTWSLYTLTGQNSVAVISFRQFFFNLRNSLSLSFTSESKTLEFLFFFCFGALSCFSGNMKF